MANMMKWTKMQAMAIIAHQERTGATHSNHNIDPEMTPYNYSVWPYDRPDQVGEKHGWRRLTQRLEQLKWLHRKDVNVLVEWTIHLGVDVPPGYDTERDFFFACMRYCERKYGAENIIYGIVHVDEETPHLTVGIVPVVKKPLKLRKNASDATRAAYEAAVAAGKDVVETLDANALITRKHLQGWHGELAESLTEQLGYDPAVYTGITEHLGGNMTVKQLKAKSADWRETRNRQAAAFHENRRAAKGLLGGRKASLSAKLNVADPKRPKIQSPVQPEKADGQKPSLMDQILDAKSRGGHEG